MELLKTFLPGFQFSLKNAPLSGESMTEKGYMSQKYDP